MGKRYYKSYHHTCCWFIIACEGCDRSRPFPANIRTDIRTHYDRLSSNHIYMVDALMPPPCHVQETNPVMRIDMLIDQRQEITRNHIYSPRNYIFTVQTVQIVFLQAVWLSFATATPRRRQPHDVTNRNSKIAVFPSLFPSFRFKCDSRT